jgi:hypothetical protein
MNKLANTVSALLVSLVALSAAVLVYQHSEAPKATYAALQTSSAGLSLGP